MINSRLNDLMPRADLAARYDIIIAAPADAVYRAARAMPMMQVNVARWLLWLRALPARVDSRASSEGSSSFLLLNEEANREVVFGLAGQFWHPSRNITRLPDAEAWQRFARDGSAKAAINYLVEPLGDGRARLSTETRVACFGATARRVFKLYWFVVGPWSGLIRKDWLRRVKRKVEVGG